MKLSKVLSIVAIAMILLASVSNVVLALDPGTLTPTTNGTGVAGITGIGNKVIGFLQVGGSVLAVGVLVVLGIKYMMGSAEEKAEYKKTMVPYIVGAVLIFGAVNIGGWIYDFAITVK